MYINMYIMESREIVLVNLCTEKKWRCRHREWTSGHSGERRGWEKLRKCY